MQEAGGENLREIEATFFRENRKSVILIGVAMSPCQFILATSFDVARSGEKIFWSGVGVNL